MGGDIGGTDGAETTRDVFRRGYLPVIAGAVCTSFSPFFVKGSAMPPSTVAFYRLVFGGVALLLVALARRTKLRPSRSVLLLMACAGAFFSGDLLFWHESILLIGPGIATILSNLEVILLALYSVFALGERMSWRQRLSIPLALFGMALLLGLHESSFPDYILKGALFALASAVFYSMYILTLRRSQAVADRLSPVANMAWVSLAGAVVVGTYCLCWGQSLRIPDAKTIAGVAFLGISCQALGWLLYSIGLPHISPFLAGLLMLIQPSLAFVWDVAFFGATPKAANVVGAVLAIGAIGMGIASPAKKREGDAEA